jgi:hypothetical protein
MATGRPTQRLSANRATRRQTPKKAAALKVVPEKAPPADQKKETSQAKRLSELEHQVKTLTWLHAELVHGLRMMIAQRMVQDPTVQARLTDELVRKMASGPLQGQPQ